MFSDMTRIILASTLHDPTGGMAPFLAEHAAAIRALYADVVIVATPQTSAETLNHYRNNNCRVHTTGTASIGDSRRDCVRRARQRNADFIHYCDADRLLKWIIDYPDELEALIEQAIPQLAFLAIGRTERAFATHPLVQRETEYISNRVFSYVYGEMEQVLDVVAGSCSMSRDAAAIILAESIEPTNATDAEWPMIIDQLTDGDIAFVETEGLEFETAFFMGEEVHETSNNAENWLNRTRLATDTFEAAMRVKRLAEAGGESN